MTSKNLIQSITNFYTDGFRQMTWGRTLWVLILLKLFIIFGILKLFFFPDFLSSKAKGDEAGYVSTQLIIQAMNEDEPLESTDQE